MYTFYSCQRLKLKKLTKNNNTVVLITNDRLYVDFFEKTKATRNISIFLSKIVHLQLK